ncbi:MAG: glycosyltransferase family 9 protein [Deltaproteobacteria bacterium]|nr:glycosyltransferase family 9 protein [Deltaproteobacteria bacterium]
MDEIISLDLSAISNLVANPRRPLSEKFYDLSNRVGDLKRKDYDLIYNLNFSKISALLSQFFKEARVIGYRLNPKNHKLEKYPWVHYVFHLMQNRNLLRFNLVDLLAGYETGESPPCSSLIYEPDGLRDGEGHFRDLPAPEAKVIGLQLGCGGNLRRWPAENFASLAYDLVRNRKMPIVLFGSKDEAHLGKAFSRKWKEVAGEEPPRDYVINLIGKTSIPQLAKALKRCDLLITGDTGTMHLAASVGTRVLAIFLGTALCHETGPYGNGHFVIQAEVPCFPCTEGTGNCGSPACRELIPAGTVYEFLSFILQEPGAQAGNLLSPEVSFPHWDRRIQVYRSVIDEWGCNFRPLIPKRAGHMDIMAGVYREGGRKLMRPTYPIDPGKLIQEFSANYGGMADGTKERAAQIRLHLGHMQNLRGSSADLDSYLLETIRKSAGSLDVLIPLHGFLVDMKKETAEKRGLGEEISNQPEKIFKTIVDEMRSLLEQVSR